VHHSSGRASVERYGERYGGTRQTLFLASPPKGDMHVLPRTPSRRSSSQNTPSRSTLAIWTPGRRHRSRVPWYSLDFLRVGARRQPAKGLLISLHLLGVPTAHEERRGTGARRGCPEEVCAPGRGPRRGPEEPQRKVLSGRLVESLEERSGIGASEMCPLREDGRGACPTLFSSKWLKSTSTHFGE
jgi:hypothetical protein